MNLWLAIVVIVAVTAVSVIAMLLVRRGAPDGSRFQDGDRASGVFGVLATGFSVLVGFVVFLAFTTYDQARSGAETEALTMLQQVETALLMPEAAQEELIGALICYGRTVVEQEWPALSAGGRVDDVNPWGLGMVRTIEKHGPTTASEEAAFGKWLDQTSAREEARLDRLHGAEGIIPAALWVVLFLTAAVLFFYMLFFADSGEEAIVQGFMMGSVAAIITAMLLLLAFLDKPYEQSLGGIDPVAMERTLVNIEEALPALGRNVAVPCAADGTPTA